MWVTPLPLLYVPGYTLTASIQPNSGRQGFRLFSSRVISARTATLPSEPSFRTRGTQPDSLSGFVYSSTNTSCRRTATPVGDQGFSAFNTVSTLPPVVTFTTQRQPLTAA